VSSAPRLSLVVPAHNEGALLTATLNRALEGARPGEFDVVIVANGCTDDTVTQARAIPGARVVQIEAASKVAALNAGDEATTVFPRVYLDADVEVDAATLRSLADALRAIDEPRVASPRLRVDATASTWAVQQHVRVWEQSAYRRRGHIGSGVYAVNESGRRRWGAFPDVIADDRFVQQSFLPAERITLDSHSFTVRAPRDMAAHIRRATRIEAGNRTLRGDQQRAAAEPAAIRFSRLLGRVAAQPALWPALPVYLYGYGVPLVRARALLRSGDAVAWSRDASLRTAARDGQRATATAEKVGT
jgi:Glycosyl transferase family 2